jgi:hypothetical protein
MPNRWPISSGNWSNAAIWSGSIIPTASDDVFLNNRTVTLDQDINVLTLRNNSIAGVTAGGVLAITGSYNITSSNGINSSGANTANGMIQYVGSGSLNISGSILINGINTIRNFSTGTIRLIGNVLNCTGTNGAYAIYNLSAGTIIVTGSVYGGNLNYNGKWGIYNASAGNIFISGSVFGGNGGQQAIGVQNASAGLVIINGNAFGGGTSVDGTVVGNQIGAVNSSNGVLIIQGTISASIISPAVTSTSTTATNLFTGPFYNTGSYNAVYAYRMQVFDQPTRWTFDTETAGITKTLTTVESITGAPSTSDVRDGVTYGLNGNLTGSLKMPNPTTVRLGVAVDNTTGSAIFTAEDMFGVLTQNITDSGSIGTLLTGASTVQTVGATISSFKV